MRYLGFSSNVSLIKCTSCFTHMGLPKEKQDHKSRSFHFNILLFNRKRLQSSDGSAQDQGMNVMSSYKRKNNEKPLSTSGFHIDEEILLL